MYIKCDFYQSELGKKYTYSFNFILSELTIILVFVYEERKFSP